ncbi:hypothetical protein [Amycolatopsis sp. cmx-4-61]|uniref:hypothetical protein n=1 Tax=Amycolatopsis sp. cmx-4-61 TaxID=2790937 RepID=UPI00397AFF7B
MTDSGTITRGSAATGTSGNSPGARTRGSGRRAGREGAEGPVGGHPAEAPPGPAADDWYGRGMRLHRAW